MAKITYDSVVKEFKQSKATIKCPNLIKSLEALGFVVEKCRSGNHHTYTHPGMSHFYGGDFDCGHGRVPTVLPRYIDRVIKVLEKYSEEIKDYLMENGDE